MIWLWFVQVLLLDTDAFVTYFNASILIVSF